MKIYTDEIKFSTKGFDDIIDITKAVVEILRESSIKNGIVTLFIPGSTGGITTIEYEPGLKKDFPEMMEKIAPQNKNYHHNETWHDGNGFSHLRASLIGPSLTVPIANGELTLGTWQQIVFIDFDNRSRKRSVIAHIIGD
ncbi:YjbQ family protein [candidate division WOR-3 bacterium]|nr:YjbQ family protein [candidate division WOR-3 bacterium]